MVRRIVTHPWEYAVEPFHVAGNIYYVGNKHVCSYLIDTGAGLILMDTAWPQTVYLLLDSIRCLGFDPNEIRYIIHSHAHCDHIGGTRSIVELTDAETFLGKGDIEFIKTKPDLTWSKECGYDFHQDFMVDHALELMKQRHVDILTGLHPDQNSLIEKQVILSEPQVSFIDSSEWTALLARLGKKAHELFGLN
jgi:glyoxylase-like metal-dependent hydrolase (beta-lactamase superfamily II)